MTIRHVIYYPDEFLRKKAIPVEDFESEATQDIFRDMLETIQAYKAQGLAAPQIGIPYRIIVIKNSGRKEVENKHLSYDILVNPEIIDSLGTLTASEGCLSFPGGSEMIERSQQLHVKYQTPQGLTAIAYYDNIDAVAIQHEIDHLNGVLFIDKMSKLKRDIIERKVRKFKKRIKVVFK